MHNKLKVQTSVSNGLLIIAFFLVAIGFIIWGSGNLTVSRIFFLLSLGFIVTAFLTVLKTVTISCYDNDDIVLYFNSRNREEVTNFASRIINASNAYLLNKYGKLDRDLPIQGQLNSLEFLRNREIITEEQFERLKDQLFGRENKSSIGFNQ